MKKSPSCFDKSAASCQVENSRTEVTILGNYVACTVRASASALRTLASCTIPAYIDFFFPIFFLHKSFKRHLGGNLELQNSLEIKLMFTILPTNPRAPSLPRREVRPPYQCGVPVAFYLAKSR